MGGGCCSNPGRLVRVVKSGPGLGIFHLKTATVLGLFLSAIMHFLLVNSFLIEVFFLFFFFGKNHSNISNIFKSKA